MEGEIIVGVSANESVCFECRWCISPNIDLNTSSNCWQTVDILIRKKPESAELLLPNGTITSGLSVVLQTAHGGAKVEPDQFGSFTAFKFLLECLVASCSAQDNSWRAVKLIVPCTPGYIVRSDIVPLRLVDCPFIEFAVSFSTPQQHFAGGFITGDTFEHLAGAFALATSGLLIRNAILAEDSESELQLMEAELQNRLSFPWIMKDPRPPQTLAIVRGGRLPPERGGTSASIYPAAIALGIRIIVLDSPGHWIEDDRYAQFREAFIPVDLQRDESLPKRIVEAIRNYGRKVDGVVTFFESYMSAVAKAAQELSFPTAAPEALDIATDKYKTSLAAGHKAFRASSFDEADHITRKEDISYPLIVKPTLGWLSEGVSRVQNPCDLSLAIDAINTKVHGKDFVIEEYCDGPEVDANIVLDNGELLFFEVSDEFPKVGDSNNTGGLGSFIELANVLPSKLPMHELRTLRESLHQTLLQIGLNTGVFHLEARVKDSGMEYVCENGLTELVRRQKPLKRAPSAWLIEINPRSPGIQASDAVLNTYGVEYWSLCLLFALNDKERARALSQPFRDGPQYWCQMVFIPVDRGGVFDADNVCDELAQRRPDLAAHISTSICFFERGQAVPSPESGLTAWVAHFNVVSRTSRKHLLEVAELVRKEVRFSIV